MERLMVLHTRHACASMGLTEPIYTKYKAFNLKAIDRIPKNRRNDTELKFIFDFIENHWDDGNKFRIKLESTYYACESCQGYLVYLKKLAKKNGKVLDIEVTAEETVRGAESLSDYLRTN